MSKPTSLWALPLGVIAGVPVKIHFTFFLFLAWIGMEASGAGSDPLNEVLFILAIFGCVLLHELGHMLTARKLGIRTSDIVLYPFGGVASILEEPGPRAELLVTIAGPLVNIAIAAILIIGFDLNFGSELFLKGGFIARLAAANIVLFVFNLIPAYPMDGGRILRALLKLAKVRSATVISARLSQILSLMLGGLGLYIGSPILVFISAIVFLNALQENVREKTKQAALGLKASDVMTEISRLTCFIPGTTISQALAVALKSYQNTFPVILGESLIGTLDRDTLLSSGAWDEDDYITAIMNKSFVGVGPLEELSRVIELFHASNAESLLVLDQGKLIGIISRDHLYEYLVVNGLRSRARALKGYLDEEV